jgi:hypothetical protein
MFLLRAKWAKNFTHQAQARTLDAFALAHPEGHYIWCSNRHALAVCDGVVLDGWNVSGLLRLSFVFEVIA